MANFVYPTAAELTQIAQEKIPRLIATRPVFDIFPMRNRDTSIVMWEQQDNYVGLQQVRGVNGEPPSVKPLGLKRYQMAPGTYGEFSILDEMILTERRRSGTFADRMNIEEMVMEKQDHLLGRRLDRVEKICWDLLVYGTFSIAGANGAIMHTDTYTTQTFTASVAWGTFATATPLADLRAVQLLSRGRSVNFGSSAQLFVNLVTANQILNNLNPSDLYGRRNVGLSTYNTLASINSLLTGDNLPGITVYDEGYLDESAVFQPFIPNNKAVLVGQRPAGQTVGEYQMTRNANNPDAAPGPYMRVIDRGDDDIPRKIEVHDGHNGGPALYFPTAIVVMTV